MKEIYIKLWRDKPPLYPLKDINDTYPLKRIFPSGRQALSIALELIGLSRPKRVALPEWSSHCVISSVGKIATPIPINEVLRLNMNVDAVLLYEQWGWPILEKFKDDILKKFKNSIIILDRVDSADINNKNRIQFYPDTDQIDLISLSKLLGLPGGGLVKLNGNYLSFKPELNDKKISEFFWSNEISKQFFPQFLHIHMSNIEYLHPELNNWLLHNDLSKVLQNEYSRRRKNLFLILNSELSEKWPEWMFKASKNGAGPGIVPLLKNKPLKILKKTQEFTLKSLVIESIIYHFN